MPQLVRYALQASLALFAMTAVHARAGDIFKCVDASGRVTYQGEPCANGRAVDIAPGQFDPEAAQRLREEQAAWNARQDLRREAAAREAAANAAAAQAAARQREADARLAEQQAADASSCSTCIGDGSWIWATPPWIGPLPPRPQPPRPPRPPPQPPPRFIVVR